MKPSAPAQEPKYSAIQACLVALVRPVTAVRRADHLPLWKAWGVHCVGLGMLVLVSLLLQAWSMCPFIPTLAEFIEELIRVLEIFGQVMSDVESWALLCLLVVLIEVVWCVLAVVMMPWSAREEKIRQSYGRVLRRLLLMTPHTTTMMLLGMGAVIRFERSELQANDFYGFISAIIYMLIIGIASIWLLWVVLATIGFDRPGAVSRWPARCMDCGYELAGNFKEHDCPECGRLVADSIDPALRPGIAQWRGLDGWVAQSWCAVRRPTEFGRLMHVHSSDTGHRRSLMYTLVCMLLGSWLGIALMYMIMTCVQDYTRAGHRYDPEELILVVLVGGTVIGLLGIAVITVTALLASGLVGIMEGWRVGRNLMPAAVRASCYQSGFMVLWSVVCWCNLTAMVIASELDLVVGLAIRLNIMIETIVFTWQFSVIGLGLLIYVMLMIRATRAAKHANW